MTQHINKVELQGVVGQVRTLELLHERKVYRFFLCTNSVSKSLDGNIVITSAWHRVQIAESRPDELDWLQKGKLVHLTGLIRYDKYIVSGDGSERIVPVIIADDLLSIQDDGTER